MGSQSESKLPIIDLSNETLNPETESWISTCNKIRLALEQLGCFLVIYNKVSMELHNSLFESAKELFDLPIQTKTLETSHKPYHSYFGQYSFLPLYESMAVDNPTTVEAAQKFTTLMWPAGNHHFCESVWGFSSAVAELEEMVTRMVFDGYGVSELFESSVEATSYLLRCFRYRVPEKEERNLGLHSHTDLTFLSIIHQNLIGGLQIQSPDGDWIDVEPLGRSSFVVMAGDALMAWSNDRIRPCRHRVVMSGDRTRYSAGLFSFKRGTTMVPAALVDEANPLRYKPFDHFQFLAYDKANSSAKSVHRIRDYCGL